MPPEPTPGLGEIAYDLTLQRSHATLPRTTTISQLFTWLKATTSIYFAQLWLDNNAELDFLSYRVLTLLEVNQARAHSKKSCVLNVQWHSLLVVMVMSSGLVRHI